MSTDSTTTATETTGTEQESAIDVTAVGQSESPATDATTADSSADAESGESTADAESGESTAGAESGETADSEAGEATSKDKSSGQSVVDTEGEIAADYLEELLDIADLDGDIDTYAERGRAQVSVVTDSQVLVGKDGQVLEALQELVRLAVMAETGNRTRLMLDVAGFREKRRKELRELAADAVQEVKDSSEQVRLAPMNPFERKIVHDAVAEAGLASESEGEEPQRRVVVLPA